MLEQIRLAASLNALICVATAGAGCSSNEVGHPEQPAAPDGGSASGGRTSMSRATGGANSTTNAGGANSTTNAGGTSGTGGSGPSSGGSTSPGGSTGTGGKTGSGGSTQAGGSPGTGASGGSSGGSTGSACDAPGLVWKTGAKTNFTSYPAPGSVECIQYSGCLYEGQFAGCSNTEPKSWVMSHNIVAAFPDFNTLKLHDLCLKSGTSTIVVTVLDTCGDSDCNGCCTQNKGNADELIDVESFTDARWGVSDGRIQWADLGPTKGSGCQ